MKKGEKIQRWTNKQKNRYVRKERKKEKKSNVGQISKKIDEKEKSEKEEKIQRWTNK